MSDKVRVALVQMCSGREVEPNLHDAENLIREAAASGAKYIQTPENTALMELEYERLLANTSIEASNAALVIYSALADELAVWLHIGSHPVKIGNGRLANRSYLFAPNGEVAARYDKIHMFDADLPGGESYRESDRYRPGTKAVVAELPWGKLGLSICYDLRFPALYRALAKQGALVLAAPAAFAKVTGKAHWHVLLRARAIETGCFMLASGQSGLHENGRETYGHSMIISPWGEIIAEAETERAMILADLDLSEVARARTRIASINHDREFDFH